MRKNLKSVKPRKTKARQPAKRKDILEDRFVGVDGPIDTQHLMISMLLPPAVKEFVRQLEAEVEALCGHRYQRGFDNNRWGSQGGSIVLGNQHVAIDKPRVRSKVTGDEVPLQVYEEFQSPELFERSVFAEGMKRVSQRDYEKGLQKIGASFGFKKSNISRKWIKATSKKLEQLQQRSLKEMDIRAIFLDGKRFRKHGVIIALGIASNGKKYVLGIYQASNEDHGSCLNLLNDLEERGLPMEGLLFVVDGGSGLNKALNIKYQCDDKKKRKAVRVRCHIHKWRNIDKALGDDSHYVRGLFSALREAKNMKEAEDISARLESELKHLNLSALNSYLEGKEDLLAIHSLNLSTPLKRFFSTTNPIESLNSLLEDDMRRVRRWSGSEQFQRWLATYCLASEHRMRRPNGHSSLPALWIRLRQLTEHCDENISIENKNQVA